MSCEGGTTGVILFIGGTNRRYTSPTWGSLHESEQSPPRLSNFRPVVTQLEDRTTPAVYAVGMLSPSTGDVGSSAATFTGGIALDTTLPTQDGKAVVTAANSTAAIQAALVNTVTATVGGQSANYQPGPTTVSTPPSAQLPFVVTTTTTAGEYVLHLEDLALMPGMPPDWDYNDRTWTVTVTELTTISVATPTPGEESADGSRPVVVELTRANGTAGSLDQPLYLPYTLSGTATPGVDYTPPSASIAVFWPGEATTKIVLPALPDTVIDGSETIIVHIEPPIGVAPTPIDVTVPIFDPGTLPPAPPVPPPSVLPEVWVSGSLDGEERTDGLRPVVFQLSRTNPSDPATAPALTIGFSLSGVATVGVDYTTPYSFMATFAPGELTTLVTLGVLTDDLYEGYESVTLTALPGSGYTVVSGSATGVADIFDLGTMPPARGVASVSGTVWLDGLQNNLQDPFGPTPLDDSSMAAVRVTLLDGNGNAFLSTYTDAAGNYSFTRLPYGQYRVLVSIWGMEQFVLPNYGGSQFDLIDSDVYATGYTDVFELTPANPNADRDAGAFLGAPPANAADKSVHILLPGEVVPGELKVAKWQFLDKEKNEAFVDGANNLPKLDGVSAAGRDHIDWDPDRFNVFVKDTAKRGQQAIDVTMSTMKKGNGGAPDVINDNATKITLVNFWKEGMKDEWKDWFWSDSQMLVSSNADDKFERAVTTRPGSNDPANTSGGLGKDDTDPGAAPNAGNLNKKNGYEFPLGDRTHRIALGEFVKVENDNATPAEVEVKVRKTVNLKVRILVDTNLPVAVNNDNNPGQVISKADVEADIAYMKEIYARVGIKVVEDITVETVPAAEPGPNGLPAVDLRDGLTTYDRIDGARQIILSPEAKALFKNTGMGRTPTVGQVNGQGGVDDIEVYYANNLVRPNLLPGQRDIAQSYFRNAIVDAEEKEHADAVIMSSGRRPPFILSHEVFHVLENRVLNGPKRDHYPYKGVDAVKAERVNLMAIGTSLVHDVLPGGPYPPELWSVRLNEEQQARADIGPKEGAPTKSELLS